jgi:hypothetical protein
MADPEALGEMEQQAQQAAAAASAEQALAAAFAGLLCNDSKLLQVAPAEPGGLTVLYEVGGCNCKQHKQQRAAAQSGTTLLCSMVNVAFSSNMTLASISCKQQIKGKQEGQVRPSMAFKNVDCPQHNGKHLSLVFGACRGMSLRLLHVASQQAMCTTQQQLGLQLAAAQHHCWTTHSWLVADPSPAAVAAVVAAGA